MTRRNHRRRFDKDETTKMTRTTNMTGITGQPTQRGAGAEGVEEAKPDPRAERRALLFVIGVALLIILIFGGWIGYTRWHTLSVIEKNRYNGFDFTEMKEGNSTIWVTRIEANGQPYVIPFYYHPRETESVVLEERITDRFQSKTPPKVIFLTFDPKSGTYPVIGGVEISRVTGYRYKLFNIETRSALQQPTGSGAEQLILTCANATQQAAILSFDFGDKNIVYRDQQNPWCIHLEYRTPEDAVRVADRFVYGLLRIMPG